LDNILILFKSTCKAPGTSVFVLFCWCQNAKMVPASQIIIKEERKQ